MFLDLRNFVAIPRVAALRLAPDGTWLAAAVQTLSADQKKYLTSIWRVYTQGGPVRRLTRFAEGEGSPRFLPDGSLLFTSKCPDPDRKNTGPDGKSGSGSREEVAGVAGRALAVGGEASVAAALPGGVTAAEVARDAGGIVVKKRAGAARCGGTTGNGSSAEDDAAAPEAQGRRDHRHNRLKLLAAQPFAGRTGRGDRGGDVLDAENATPLDR